jgi:hypothetical protein
MAVILSCGNSRWKTYLKILIWGRQFYMFQNLQNVLSSTQWLQYTCNASFSNNNRRLQQHLSTCTFFSPLFACNNMQYTFYEHLKTQKRPTKEFGHFSWLNHQEPCTMTHVHAIPRKGCPSLE